MSDNHTSDDDKKPKLVGYKNPPTHSRFVKGESGNPNGRPKGSRNIFAELREELQGIVEFHDGTQSHTITRQRAVIKRLIQKSIGGDTRATAILFSIFGRRNDYDDDPTETAEDAEILRREESRLAHTND
jgi:hypothetical protein